jgi:hypothetical protein
MTQADVASFIRINDPEHPSPRAIDSALALQAAHPDKGCRQK